MKRLISMILVLATLFSLTGTLFGCGKETEVVMSVGQWLALINDAFGMQSYTEEKPYFDNIPAESPYFGTVQIAAEWDIVDTEESLDVNETLTWETALVTLVNAGNFIDVESSTDDKVDYAVKAFDDSIRNYWRDRDIPYEDAILLLTTAQSQWVNKTYTEEINNITYNEGVKDLTDEIKTDYTMLENQVVIDSALVEDVEEGDIYILQSQENPLEFVYYRAEEITEVDGVTYITNSEEELELEDVAQEVKLQGTVTPTTDNTVIYDANGNIIAGPQVVTQSMSGGEAGVVTLGVVQTGASTKHSFEVDGYTISLSYNLDGNLDMKIGVETGNLLGKDADAELKGEASFEVSKLKITREFDYSVWKGLKSATLKVDYETETEFGVSYSSEPLDLVAAPEYSNGNGKFLTNFKRAILKDRDGQGAKTIASKKEIKICSLNVYNAGVAKICLDVNLQIAVDGSLSVKITQGGTVGIEYKKGNLRLIKKNTKSAEAELKAQVELTIGFGPALYIIGLKKKLIGVEVRMGVGAEASLKMHLADSESHLIEELSFNDTQAEECEVFTQIAISADAEAIKAVAEAQGCTYSAEAGAKVALHVDVCFDVSVYGILKVGLSDNCYAKKFIGSKVTVSWTIFSSKNAKFFNYHVDNGDWANAVVSWGSAANGDVCTLDYVPFDSEEDTEPEEETTETPDETVGNNEDILVGEFIALTEFCGEVSVGGRYCISIAQLPAGYTLADIVYESGDTSIAKVNSQGVVEGVKGGSTLITVRTSDGKYTVAMAIYVSDDYNVDFEGIQT